MIEEWKEVRGFNRYFVSNLGEIKSKKQNSEKILKPSNTHIYNHVILLQDRIRYTKLIHVLVAEAFLNYDVKDKKIVVDHINNNPLDNNLSNLQIITPRLNRLKDSKKTSTNLYGVHWLKKNKKWMSCIHFKDRQIFLGVFNSDKDASNAYNKVYYEIEHGIFDPEKWINERKEKSTNKLLNNEKKTSKYLGVSWDKKGSRWSATMSYNSNFLGLGFFKDEEDAHKIRERAQKEKELGIFDPNKYINERKERTRIMNFMRRKVNIVKEVKE